MNRIVSPSARFFFLAASSLVAGCLWATAAAAQSPARAESQQLLDVRTRETLDAEIVLSGRVRDDAGRPLFGVEARVEKVSYDPASPGLAKSESELVLVDDYFRFTCPACIAIRVGFSHHGYHLSSLEANYSETKDQPGPGKRPKVDKIENVVLRAQGRVARLDRFEGRLVVREGGDEEVLPVGEKASGGPAFLKVLPKDSKSGQPLPFLRLEVPKSGNEIVTRALVGKAGSEAPQAARIDFGATGGVLRYQPRARDIRAIRYEMREAPEQGYEPTLELDPASEEIVYFYCKIGELYGRGSATPTFVEATQDGKRVVSHVEVELNPDGSRNLETLE